MQTKVYSLEESYDLTINVNGSGSVNIENGTYPAGTSITLSVSPASEEWLFADGQEICRRSHNIKCCYFVNE